MSDLGHALFGVLKAKSEPGNDPQFLETHISWVLLSGKFAWKIKKPVDFGFVNFTTLQKRHHFCEEEIRINRRLAPDLYLDVVPISGTLEKPELEGTGEPIDYAVKMKRFPQQQLLHEVVARNELTTQHIDELAELVARFHQQIAGSVDESYFGTRALIEQAVVHCYEPIRKGITRSDHQKQLRSIEQRMAELGEQLNDVWETRRKLGMIRECHGDLHLANIALIDDQVTVFDAIDFNPELRWCDVMSELAFLVMDFERHNRRDEAYRILNRYCELTGDYEGLVVLPYYMAYRALVRAKVMGLRWQQEYENKPIPDEEQEQMGLFLRIASDYAHLDRARLLITHGFSGSGKTTATQILLEQLGAIRIRSDVERKRMFDSKEDLYSSQKTEATYERLEALAEQLLKAGFPVIVDATFLKRQLRQRFQQLADRCQVEFTIIDFHAPEEVLRSRLKKRAQQGTDASDADTKVLELQLNSHDPFDEEEQQSLVEIDTTKDLWEEMAKLWECHDAGEYSPQRH